MDKKVLEAMYLLGTFKYSKRISDPLKGVDIEEEYKLIQQKKSDLSTRLRNMVIGRYNALHMQRKQYDRDKSA